DRPRRHEQDGGVAFAEDLVEDLDPVPFDIAVLVRVRCAYRPPFRLRGWRHLPLQSDCNATARPHARMASVNGHTRPKGATAMAMTKEKAEATSLVYDLQGTLLEACSCGVLCPCWVGEDPDGGACDAFVAYHFDGGTIRGIDVGGLSLVNVVKIPGNVLTPASWKIVMFVDERATDEQLQALIDAYSGNLGGPMAALAGL